MKLKSIVYIILASLLTGCVAAVVAGAAGGLAVYDRRSIRMIERDARIFHVMRNAIIPNPRFRDSRIVVSSFNQTVLLAGQTPNASLRIVAEKIAQKTPGVRHVYDEITIGYPISLSQQSKDTWITSQVRSKLLTEKNLESGSIHIITENATVYLMGIVTPEQANLAVNAARQIKGVRTVVKVFQYIR